MDPLIVGAVEHVRDRFGVQGLKDMITLAQDELARTEEAMSHFNDPE